VPNAGWLLHEGRGVECGEVSSRLKDILEISKGKETGRIALYFDRLWAVLAKIFSGLGCLSTFKTLFGNQVQEQIFQSLGMGDRTLYVPSHEGENVLPNLPWFHKLLRYAQRKPSRVAVRDVNAGIERTYHHLISDVLAFRNVLRERMSSQILRDLAEDKEVYIGLLAPGGYEYTVGFIAIIALGAAVVPMGESMNRFTTTHIAGT